MEGTGWKLTTNPATNPATNPVPILPPILYQSCHQSCHQTMHHIHSVTRPDHPILPKLHAVFQVLPRAFNHHTIQCTNSSSPPTSLQQKLYTCQLPFFCSALSTTIIFHCVNYNLLPQHIQKTVLLDATYSGTHFSFMIHAIQATCNRGVL